MSAAPEALPGPHLTVGPDGIAWITFDDPTRRLNVLTETVLGGLAVHLEDLRAHAAAGDVRMLIVRSGKEAGFIAGADLEVVQSIEDPLTGEQGSRLGQAIFTELESLPIPTVCAIHGACMGGGTEMALACTYRLASDSRRTRIALPEVQLGLLPGWGGTTRLPRLVGLQDALDVMLTGKHLSPAKARRIGLVDAVLPADLFDEKVEAFARDRLEKGPVRTGARRSLLKRLGEDTAPGRRVILATARKRVMARTGGHYPAPLKILEVVGRSLGRSVDAALRIEAAAFGELLVTGVSKNLIHVFHLRNSARKLPSDLEGRRRRSHGLVARNPGGRGHGRRHRPARGLP